MAQRRDRSNELIVAIVVIGTLALALTFGIILTLSSNADEDTDIKDTPTQGEADQDTPIPTRTLVPPTDTPPPDPMLEALAAATNVRNAPEINADQIGLIYPGTWYRVLGRQGDWYQIEYPESPDGVAWVYARVVLFSGDAALLPDLGVTQTVEPTTVAAIAPTDAPTETPTVTPTGTPTETLTATPTETPEPSATATRTASPTITPTLRISHTPTKVSTATPRPTATPTLTPTITLTRTPSITPSPTPTFTPTLTPSLTYTPSKTPTPTLTFTPSNTPSITPSPTPTVTLTFTPYPTLTPSITPLAGEQTATPSASGCPIPSGWVTYAIQSGDTMFSLARRFGLTVNDLAGANCIADPSNITAGQILYVPPGISVTPAPIGTGIAPPAGNYTRFDCDNPSWTITQPGPGTVLRGTFAVYGTANHPQFSFYRLQISGSGTNDADFATLQVYNAPVASGQLGAINPAAFAPGDYWLRLTVVDNTGNYPPQCTVRVRFEP
jgi:LysM repeat protein